MRAVHSAVFAAADKDRQQRLPQLQESAGKAAPTSTMAKFKSAGQKLSTGTPAPPQGSSTVLRHERLLFHTRPAFGSLVPRNGADAKWEAPGADIGTVWAVDKE